jgi:hypothetical protein
LDIATDTKGALLGRCLTEWPSLMEHRHNVLIHGPVSATHAVLLELQPHIGTPVLWKRPHAPLELPGPEGGALILEDVATLTAEDQTRLLARLDGARSPIQVISTTEKPLFALVGRDLFIEALYYRLNIILLYASATDQGGPTAPDTD